eukprot:Gb_07634 [translate_table: standard]
MLPSIIVMVWRELCALQLAIKCELLGASPLAPSPARPSPARAGLMDTAAFMRPTLSTLASGWDAPISPSNLAISNTNADAEQHLPHAGRERRRNEWIEFLFAVSKVFVCSGVAGLEDVLVCRSQRRRRNLEAI